MTFEIVQRSEMLRLVIAFRSKAAATQPLMSVGTLYLHRGDRKIEAV